MLLRFRLRWLFRACAGRAARAYCQAVVAREERCFDGVAHRSLDLLHLPYAEDLDRVLLDGCVEDAALRKIDDLFARDQQCLRCSERKQSQHLTISMHGYALSGAVTLVKVCGRKRLPVNIGGRAENVLAGVLTRTRVCVLSFFQQAAN